MLQTLTSRILLLLAAALAVESAAAQLLSLTEVRDGRVEAELIAEHTALVPGETARVGLRLKMDEGWHTYWKNSGDAGLATTIEWELPEGFVAHDIDWPAPEYYEVGGLASYGYEGEIVLPVRIEVPADYAGDRVRLRATADWLVCKEACEPGTARVSLSLPIVSPEMRQIDQATQPLFAWADARSVMKRVYEDHGAEAVVVDDRYVLELAPTHTPVFAKEWVDARFFPEDPAAIQMAAAQKMEISPDRGLIISMVRNSTSPEPVKRLVGVLAWYNPGALNQTLYYRIDVPVRGGADGG
ncbi:MAG: protein-disulfide reductase DsbD domain-containing protein [Planctomycetota bacterium]